MLRRIAPMLLSAVLAVSFTSTFVTSTAWAAKKQPKCKEGTQKVPGDGTVRTCKDGDWVVEKKR